MHYSHIEALRAKATGLYNMNIQNSVLKILQSVNLVYIILLDNVFIGPNN